MLYLFLPDQIKSTINPALSVVCWQTRSRLKT